MENSELENPEFNQSTSEFVENTSEKISEVFISEFSVLGIVQNGKLGGEKPRKTVSEISENSEFSTSPYLLINRKQNSRTHPIFLVRKKFSGQSPKRWRTR